MKEKVEKVQDLELHSYEISGKGTYGASKITPPPIPLFPNAKYPKVTLQYSNIARTEWGKKAQYHSFLYI